MTKKQLKELRDYVKDQARVADKSSKEWGMFDDAKAAYRNGMWYAYRDVLNRLPTFKEGK